MFILNVHRWIYTRCPANPARHPIPKQRMLEHLARCHPGYLEDNGTFRGGHQDRAGHDARTVCAGIATLGSDTNETNAPEVTTGGCSFKEGVGWGETTGGGVGVGGRSIRNHGGDGDRRLNGNGRDQELGRRTGGYVWPSTLLPDQSERPWHYPVGSKGMERVRST